LLIVAVRVNFVDGQISHSWIEVYLLHINRARLSPWPKFNGKTGDLGLV